MLLKHLRLLTLILPLALLASCGSFWEYRSLHEFAQFTWNKSDIRTFEGEVSQDGVYDVYVLFRHVQGFPYQDMKMNFQMKTADEGHSEKLTIPVIGDNKEYLGEGSVDIWDIDHLVYEKMALKKGAVSFALEHDMNREDVQLVMEVGVMIKKAE